MHLKNISLITEDGIVSLSPCYDLVNSTIVYKKPEEEIALPLRGRKKKLTRQILIDYFGIERCDLPSKSIDKVMGTIVTAIPKWEELIDISFLSNGMKEKYLDLLNTRLGIINIQ